MGNILEITVPVLEGTESVPVTDISVSVGDDVIQGEDLVVIETEKTAIDIPSPVSGKILEILVSVDELVEEGQVLLKLESDQIQDTEPVASVASH